MSEAADINNKYNTLEALFGADLDDIADLPAFEVPPPGTYTMKITMNTKKVSNKDCVNADFEVITTDELKNKDENSDGYRPPVKEGTKFNQLWMLGGEHGGVSVGRLKQFLAPFAVALGTTKIADLVRDQIKDITFIGQITNRPSKDDPEKVFAAVKVLEVV
jgi:hypothetical protein